MDVLFLSRLQFAAATLFHFLFVPLRPESGVESDSPQCVIQSIEPENHTRRRHFGCACRFDLPDLGISFVQRQGYRGEACL